MQFYSTGRSQNELLASSIKGKKCMIIDVEEKQIGETLNSQLFCPFVF